MNKYKDLIFIWLFIFVYTIFIFLICALYVNIRVDDLEKRNLEVHEYILDKIGG